MVLASYGCGTVRGCSTVLTLTLTLTLTITLTLTLTLTQGGVAHLQLDDVTLAEALQPVGAAQRFGFGFGLGVLGLG